MMKEFIVSWSTQLPAKSHLDAVKEAIVQAEDEGSIATIFEVIDTETGVKKTCDLLTVSFNRKLSDDLVKVCDIASELIGPDLLNDIKSYYANEYVRGMCELIGDLFGIEDVPLDERAGEIFKLLKGEE